jgi:NAD(P)-dependent dehydrogenase (short-subunit alcohol dehydrogenase family)
MLHVFARSIPLLWTVPMETTQRTVLVTGCSTGIGRATVELLAERGFHVFAGVRTERDAAGLRAVHGEITPLLLDVTSDDDVARAIETIRQASPQGLYSLVNNAGIGLPAAVELTTPAEFRQLLEVNSIAPLRMIQACLPLLRETHGRIVNVSSMNGTMALPMVGAYSASKFALEALSDTLRVELRPWQISVSLIRPGQIRTTIFDKAREAIAERIGKIPAEVRRGYEKMYHRAAEFNERGATSRTLPDAVARAILHALSAGRPRTHYHVGLDAVGIRIAKWHVPTRLVDRAVARMMQMLYPLE